MGLTAKEGGGSFQQPPVGTHLARCIRLIDIGTQKKEFNNKVKWAPQVIIAWELPHEMMEATDEHPARPFVVSKFYTMSLDKKANLRKHLASWRGRDFTPEELKGFDLRNILDKPCMLSIILNEKEKAIVDAVMSVMKGTTLPPRHHELEAFDLEQWMKGDPTMNALFSSFSEKMQELIKGCQEVQEAGSYTDEPPHPADGEEFDPDSDIPF